MERWNIHDLEFDLSRSRKVKLKVAILKVIYDFLLVFNSNLRPNSIRYRDIGCQMSEKWILGLFGPHGPKFRAFRAIQANRAL